MDKLKQWITSKPVVDELRSFLHTFVATLAVDASVQFQSLINGDWSSPVLIALGTAVLRAFLKALDKALSNGN